MPNLIIAGVDPGVVHTGVTVTEFHIPRGGVKTHSRVFSKVPAIDVSDFIRGYHPTSIYIEDYNPRSNFNNDVRMLQAVGALRQVMPQAKMVDNAGATTLVTRQLMELLGVWKFNTPTHHQDLRSAARIALFGMLKNKNDPAQRAVLSRMVQLHLEGHHIDATLIEH